MKIVCFDNKGFDLLAIEKINPSLMSIEPDLFHTKWWDYRIIHPVQSTYLFADAYKKAARDYWIVNWDMEAGAKRKPLSGWDCFEKPPIKLKKNGEPYAAQIKGVSKTDLQGLWKARQKADSLGMPYSLYCRYAITYAKKGLWKNIPRPTQLYQTKIPEAQLWREQSMMDYIESMWASYQAQRTVMSTEDYFLAINNRYEREQILHRGSVMAQIKKRTEPAWGLVYALHENPVLIEAECRKFFGDDVVNRSKILASS